MEISLRDVLAVNILDVYKLLNTENNNNIRAIIEVYGIAFFSNLLTRAVSFNDLEKVKYLVEVLKVDVNNEGSVYNGEWNTNLPLSFAVMNNNFQLVKYLLENGADPNGISDSLTPIYIACGTGCLKIVNILVKYGANIEFSDVDNYTCLMRACLDQRYKAVEFLLLKHAEKNRTTTNGDTALHLSAMNGDLKMVKLLLKHGADENILNHERLSPIMVASLNFHTYTVEYIASLPTCDKKEKVKAFEILGVFYIHKNDDLNQARKVWKLVEGQKKITSKYEVVESLEKFKSIDTLTEDEMYIRALIIRECILVYDIDLILKLGDMFAKQRKFKFCLNVFKYAFHVSDKVIKKIVPSFTACLFLMKDDNYNLVNRFEDLLEVLNIVIEEIKNKKDKCMSRQVPTILTFVYVLTLIMENNLKLKQLVNQLILLPIPCRKKTDFLHGFMTHCQASGTWLHYACKNELKIDYFGLLHIVDSVVLVSFLINAGADVNVLGSKYKRSPLHVARNSAIRDKLLEHGAISNIDKLHEAISDIEKLCGAISDIEKLTIMY